MRFKSFINESTMWLPLPGLGLKPRDIRLLKSTEIDIKEEDIDTFAQQVRVNCNEWLKEMRNKIYWRGFSPDEEEDAEAPIICWTEKDRTPKDTPYDLHTFVDDYLQKRFKWTPRSSGVFCSPRHTTANGYGSYVYAVFPIGKYRYVWGKNVYDMTERLFHDYQAYVKKKYVKYIQHDQMDKREIEETAIFKNRLKTLLDTYEYVDEDAVNNHSNELMIDCDKCLLVPETMVRDLYRALGM